MALGVIFDFDGTIFESVVYHKASWQEALSSHNKTVSDEQFSQGLGVKNLPFLKDILQLPEKEAAEVLSKKEQIYEEKVQSGGVQPIKGTFSLIRRLHEAKIPLAIGSASSKRTISSLFSRYPDVYAMFSAFVTGEDICYGKPNPEVFLKAAEALSCLPEECLVIEDAPHGIKAAKAASMRVIALTTTFSEEELLPYHPDRIVDSLEDISVQQIISLVHP